MSRIKALFQTKAVAPCHVIYDGEQLYRPGEEAPLPGVDPALVLDGLLAEDNHDGLIVHYHGRRALFLFAQASFSRYISDRLPPGRALSAYLLTTVGHCFALLPRDVAEPFFEAARRHGLLTCKIVCLPQVADEAILVRTLSGAWILEVEAGRPTRILPLPEGEIKPTGEHPTRIMELGTAAYDPPLFHWLDPDEKARLTARKNRAALLVASLAATLLLLLTGVGLWFASSVYEGRLAALSAEQQQLKARRNDCNNLRNELDKTLAGLAENRTNNQGLAPQAVRIRHIFNQFGEQVLLTRFLVERGLGGAMSYTLEGTAPDPAQVDVLIRNLEAGLKGANPILTRLEQVVQDRNQRRRAPGKEPPYRFTIVLEVSS